MSKKTTTAKIALAPAEQELLDALNAHYAQHPDAILSEADEYTRSHFVVSVASDGRGVHTNRITFIDPKLQNPGDKADKANTPDEMMDFGMALSMMRVHIETATRTAVDHYQIMKFIVDHIDRIDTEVPCKMIGAPKELSLSLLMLKAVMDQAKKFDAPDPFVQASQEISEMMEKGPDGESGLDFVAAVKRLAEALQETLPLGALSILSNAPAGAIEKGDA